MKHKFYPISNKSFAELGVKTYQELWNKVKSDHTGLSAGVDTEFIQVKAEDGSDTNRFNVIMSTASEDRHGDIVEQQWDLKAFKKNPVFLDSHNYSSIEHILGKFVKVGVTDNKLQGEVEFMLDNPKGLLAYKMAKQGFLNATSVGFIPKEFDNQGRILKSELLENSAVSVPANSEALFTEKDADEVIETATVGPVVEVPVIEPEVTETKNIKLNITKSILAKTQADREKLESVLKSIETMTEFNKAERTRSIYKGLRELI